MNLARQFSYAFLFHGYYGWNFEVLVIYLTMTVCLFPLCWILIRENQDFQGSQEKEDCGQGSFFSLPLFLLVQLSHKNFNAVKLHQVQLTNIAIDRPLRDWLVSPDDQERKETWETQESTAEMWGTHLCCIARTDFQYALVFLRQGRVRGEREEGRPLGVFIDLCSIAGQSWTCWTERRERRAGTLSSLIIQTPRVSLGQHSVDSNILRSPSRDLKGLQDHQENW